MKLILENWRRFINEHVDVFYVGIELLLPTEELGHGKEHDCPSQECEEAVEEKTAEIEGGNFQPIEVANQKPVATHRLKGDGTDLAPKSGQPETFYHVLNGHHRLEAAKRLGIKKVPVYITAEEDSDAIGEQTEPFQREVKAKHKRMKIRLIGKGGNKHNTAGKMKKPSYERAESAPAGG
jgi:hypothetical protein|tara:strand:- start:574 stop:1113 length:540 start_codon:yes stop_codon:yes gene_type:complete